MIGLNFYSESKRFVERAVAAELAAAIPSPVWRVGVFVNASRAEIEEVRSALGLSAIQLHGDEPPEMLHGWPCPVLRAVRLSTRADVDAALADPPPDYILCEGRAGGGYGGAGETFEWAWARPLPADRLIVSGGLDPSNVAEAVRTLRPYAVDVASGVEATAGIKDAQKMRELIENAKSA